jgi:cytochrome c oxidase subunit 3
MSGTPVYDLKSGKHHPFHVPHASIWPFLASCAAGLMAIGMVMFMHKASWHGFNVGAKGLILGAAGVLTMMWVWWRDVIHEAFVEKAHSSETRTGLRYGMALFISSEVMFFVAFFWAFFDSSIFPKEAIGFVWPPKGVEAVHAFDLPFLMTMILLLSGCTVTWAHHAILEGKQAESVKALAITVALGIAFTCFQAYEYYHATFHFKDGIYSSAFYMATGFHGFHVLVGSIFLTVCLFRAIKGHFSPKSHFGFEAAAWYWHFVDVVWLFLFVAVYWWGNS